MLSYFLSFVFVLPSIVIIILVILNIIIPIIVYILLKNFRSLGYVSIDEVNIVLTSTTSNPFIVPINQLTDFKISCGSTMHYEAEGFARETYDNWLSFTFNKGFYRYEFSISNTEENKKFETMIRSLRSTYPDFHYTSI